MSKISIPIHHYQPDGEYSYLHPHSDNSHVHIHGADSSQAAAPKFLWVHLPDDPSSTAWNQYYYVCSYENGNVLRQEASLDDSGHHLHHSNPDDLDGSDDRWLLRRQAVESDVVNLQMKGNGFVAYDPDDVKMTGSPSKHDDVLRMRVYTTGVPTPPIPALRAAEVNPGDSSDVPPTVSVDKAPASPTPRRLVGEQYVPYFAVNDPIHDRSWAVKNSPVYVLSRYQYWYIGPKAQVVFKEEDRRDSYQASWTVGYSATDQESMTSTVNAAVTAQFSLGFGSIFNTSWQAQVGFSLQMQTSRSITKSSTSTESVTIYNPSQTTASRHVVWQLVNVYELTRGDGSAVGSWTVDQPGSPVIVGSPT